MPDNLNELGKTLSRSNKNVSHVLTRPLYETPYIERTRDIFDNVVDFEFVFIVPSNRTEKFLDLNFMPPPSSDSTCCCSDCFCGQCEFFFGVDPILITTYPYISGTLHVYNNDVEIFNFTPTDSTTVTLGFTPTLTDIIKTCYIYALNAVGC